MVRAIVIALVLAACGDPASGRRDCGEGETRACYQGPSATRGVGGCSDGLEACVDGEWSGVCVGDVTPFVEHCDGLDEDCNGMVDDVEDAGTTCETAEGCEGALACTGEDLACAAPSANECGVCGGPAVEGIGTTCITDGCPGVLECTTTGDAAACNAAPENACGVCGGPVITGLGDACLGAAGCAGIEVCDGAGTGTACSCNPVPGQCDDNGTLRAVVAPGAGDLVITEVMPSPSAVSDALGEWFEIRVMADVDLNQVALDRVNDALAPEVIASASCLRVTAGAHLVIARNADPAMNGGLPAATATFAFSLVGGSTAAPGDVRVLSGATIVDAVTWTASTNGASRQLDPDLTDATANDSETSFCDGTSPYGTGSPPDRGTPGAANEQCAVVTPPGMCDDGGTPRPIVKPAAGQLVITEVLPDPAGTDASREWFEIANTGATAFDLNELVVARAGETGTLVQSVPCLPVAAGGFALFARSADPMLNGMLPAVDATFTATLVNSNGNVEVRDGAVILDAITWTTSTSGVSHQLDPDLFTTTDNDSATSFCPGTTPYGDGTSSGSPRAANAQCP